MKVVVGIPCLLIGGTEQQTLNLVKSLLSLKYSVSVICYFENNQNIVRLFESLGCDVILLERERKTNPLLLIKILVSILKHEHPYVFHVQYMTPGFLPIIAAKLAGVKIVFSTVHQTGIQNSFKNKMILRCASRLVTKFISVSQATEQSWFGTSSIYNYRSGSLHYRKHFTIYNSIDIEEIDKIRKNVIPNDLRKTYDLTDRMVIGTVARLEHEKGIDLLINAFEIVSKKYPEIHLLIVGDGPQKSNYFKLISSKQLTAQVKFFGCHTWDSTIRHLAIMDIIVCPSRFEGFGLVAAEAMACGKPVIASNTGGLPEVIDDQETGILVPPEDPAALASAITALIENPALREKMGAAGRRKVEATFSFTTYARQIEALYAGKY